MEEITMEVVERKKKKNRLLLPMLIVLLLALCGGGWWYMDNMAATPMPQAPVKPLARAKNPPLKKEAREPEARAKIPAFGNLDEYARLDAEAALLRKQKEVVQLKQEIANLREPAKDEKKGVSAREVEDLIAREMGRTLEAQALVKESAQHVNQYAEGRVNFLAIEGTGNSIRAVVAENGSVVRLSPGSMFRGGKVVSVTRAGMTVNMNGRKIFYPWQG